LGGFKVLFSALDARSAGIQSQIEEAEALRDEAAKLMADAERRTREAETEAQEIVRRAKADAKSLMKDARADLKAKLERREAQAEQRIARAETEAANAVRQTAADAATDAARKILSASDRSGALFDKALDDIKGQLN
jgi:F-type H+-transporting ATPase subunit b